MDKQIERAGDDNKNNIGVLYGCLLYTSDAADD